METVRVFVGSDERGGRGEIVLDHGIKKYCTGPCEVTPMRPGSTYNGVAHWEYGDWNMGRKHHRPYSGEGWATNFTCYRWSIPEVAGFTGRAVYVDADQTVHADIRELQNMDLKGHACAIRKGVIVFDCSHPFWQSSQWPRLPLMKASGAGLGVYQKAINEHGGITMNGKESALPVEWDVLDGKEMSVWDAKLNHYTAMQYQPYHPFPDRFKYPDRHPRPEVDEVFWKSYVEALCSLGGLTYPGYKKFSNMVNWAIVQEKALGLDCFGRPEGFTYYFTDWSQVRAQTRELNPHFRGILP